MNTVLIVKSTVAALGLVVGGFMILQSVGFGSDDSPKRFFYDLSEGRIYTVKVGGPVPDPGVGGAADDGYPAVIIACGSCSSSPDRRVVYLEQPTEALQAWTRLASEAEANGETIEMPPRTFFTDNTLVRLVADDTWHSLTAEAGIDISERATRKCPDGTKPRLCIP